VCDSVGPCGTILKRSISKGVRLESSGGRGRRAARNELVPDSMANRRRNAADGSPPTNRTAKSKSKSKSAQQGIDHRPRDVCAFFSDRLGIKFARPAGLTNGDLMRAAGVDIATYHSWICHRGELPESALKNLDAFFTELAKR
jgi:hypothetical protein